MPANFRTGIPGYPTGDNVRLKFTGYEADTETGLNFAEARYESNLQGRFISPDPFGGSMRPTDPQSFNRYSYTGNNQSIELIRRDWIGRLMLAFTVSGTLVIRPWRTWIERVPGWHLKENSKDQSNRNIQNLNLKQSGRQ